MPQKQFLEAAEVAKLSKEQKLDLALEREAERERPLR